MKQLLLSSRFIILLVIPFNLSATIHYVNISATGSNNGTSWANAYTDLQDAIDGASVGDDI